MIEVCQLTKDYGARRAIDNLSFDIKKGEIVGFLGPNGAGKTTTMRILAGYIPPTSGMVRIGGFDILEKSIEVRKIIGYLPETVPLYVEMTVLEYLVYFAELRGVRNSKERAYAVLALVDLSNRADGVIGKLSKGMRQRVGIAQALLHEPEVLILDEPTIGLDPGQIHEVRDLIREIGKEKTILLSTHILSEAQQVCNRVLIINKGLLVAEDTTENLQARVTGAQKIFVRLRGDVEDGIKAIASTPGVISVTQRNYDLVEFETLHADDVSPKVARAVVTANLDLIEMKPSSLSLEDIFLQLTREEQVEESDQTINSIYGEEKE